VCCSLASLKRYRPPAPKENEVLVEVHAASINSWDWDLLRGEPAVLRLGKPRYNILGVDIAGRVEKGGADRQILRSRGDRRGQRRETGYAALDRRGPGH